MPVIQRVRKATTQRGKKFIQDREPKIIENCKRTFFLFGRKSNDVVTKAVKDIYSLKKPDAVIIKKKHDILPFDDITKIEAFSRKYDSSLFLFGSHTKKRPNNIVIGRMFDHHLLDMVEFEIDNFKSLDNFRNEKILTGSKPLILFGGIKFEDDPEWKRIQNLFIDFFHREIVESVRLQGLEHVIMLTAGPDDVIFLRNYKVQFKKSGSTEPRVELEEIGPFLDLKVRRKTLASDDLFKLSCKQPKELKDGITEIKFFKYSQRFGYYMWLSSGLNAYLLKDYIQNIQKYKNHYYSKPFQPEKLFENSLLSLDHIMDCDKRFAILIGLSKMLARVPSIFQTFQSLPSETGEDADFQKANNINFINSLFKKELVTSLKMVCKLITLIHCTKIDELLPLYIELLEVKSREAVNNCDIVAEELFYEATYELVILYLHTKHYQDIYKFVNSFTTFYSRTGLIKMKQGKKYVIRLEDIEPSEGMEDVVEWMKFERLHKYAKLIQRWTYETLLTINENNFDWFVKSVGGDPVTVGAKTKLIKCFDYLRSRPQLLDYMHVKIHLCKDFESMGDVMKEIKFIMITPLKKDCPLVEQIFCLIKNIADTLLIPFEISNERFEEFYEILQKIENHKSFSDEQKEFARNLFNFMKGYESVKFDSPPVIPRSNLAVIRKRNSESYSSTDSGFVDDAWFINKDNYRSNTQIPINNSHWQSLLFFSF